MERRRAGLERSPNTSKKLGVVGCLSASNCVTSMCLLYHDGPLTGTFLAVVERLNIIGDPGSSGATFRLTLLV